MKLRSSLKVDQIKQSVRTSTEVDKYTRELKELFRELSKWD